MNNDAKIESFLNNLTDEIRRFVPNIVAETATEYYKERFQKQQWDGTPWQKLNDKYAARKKRGTGKILTATSQLSNSIRPSEVTPDKVVISAGNSKVRYAKIHNEGGRIRGVQYVRPHHRTGMGGRFQVKAFARKVNFTMPQRQFLGITPELSRRIINRIKQLKK